MKKQWILVFIFLGYSFSVHAQAGSARTLGVDWSFAFFNAKPADINHIRGSEGNYAAENSNKGLASISFRGTNGLKFETLRLNERLGLGAGIRYVWSCETTGKWDLLTNGVNYFYWIYATDAATTHYARIHSISQYSGYLGLPMEITFFPVKNIHRSRIYLKAGAELSFLLASSTQINFTNDFMDSYSEIITAQVSKPSSVNLSLYNCFGVRFGSTGKPNFGIEAFIPLLNFPMGSPGLLVNKIGAGLQLNLSIPLNTGTP
jgi:hypothetical protein